MAGAKIKMVGVAKNNLRAEFFQRLVAQAFYRRLGSYRHEDRRLDRTVRSI